MPLFDIISQTTSDPLLTTRVILALLCVVVSSSLALGVCVGLVRRMQIISPERPEPPQPATSEDDQTAHPDEQR